MFATNIITHINNFTTNNNIGLLNKEINEENNLIIKSREWYDVYYNYFKNIKIDIPELKYTKCDINYNWKNEYIRIKNTKWYELFDVVYPHNQSILFNYNNRELREIPKEIGNLVNLKILAVSDNQIKKIPMEINNLINLSDLYLPRNQIKELPKEIEKLISLRFLRLSQNQIIKLPKEISNLINLQKLYISDNQIKELPDEIINLTNLWEFSFSRNQIVEISKKIISRINLQQSDFTSSGIINHYFYRRKSVKIFSIKIEI